MMLWLLALLFTKHLIFDFVYQPPYMWQNKGTYGHPGGLAHSGLHALATWTILLPITPAAMLLALGEFVVHYHMDWFKMRYNKKKGWSATTHNEFWILLGIDQWVHCMTYLGIVALI